MPDYQGNSKKIKETEKAPAKNIEKVVVTDVIIQKRGIGRKFKDLFIAADFKSVLHYVAYDVCVPAARNMVFDALTRGGERVLFGEAASRRRNIGASSRVTYNNPINRGGGYRDSAYASPRYAPPVSPEPRTSRHVRDEFIISSREEAELVLGTMIEIIEKYDVASVADLHELVGIQSSHIDHKWGWIYLTDVQIRQVREGYLIDFPQPEPIMS